MSIWGSLLWLFSFLAVYGLGCLGAMLLVRAEQRLRDRIAQEQRDVRASERDPQCATLASPSTPAGAAERRVAPAGVRRDAVCRQ